MDPFTLALGSAIIGGGLSIKGLFDQSSALDDKAAADAQVAAQNRLIFGYQKEENDQRKNAMELDATRRKREFIRQSIAARSLALSTTTNQGAFNSSALPGAYAGISGRTNVNELGVNQNAEIGRNIFALNDKISDAQSTASVFQTQSNQAGAEAAKAGAMVSLGSTLMSNAVTIGKIGGSVGGLWGGSSGSSGSAYDPSNLGSLY